MTHHPPPSAARTRGYVGATSTNQKRATVRPQLRRRAAVAGAAAGGGGGAGVAAGIRDRGFGKRERDDVGV